VPSSACWRLLSDQTSSEAKLVRHYAATLVLFTLSRRQADGSSTLPISCGSWTGGRLGSVGRPPFFADCREVAASWFVRGRGVVTIAEQNTTGAISTARDVAVLTWFGQRGDLLSKVTLAKTS